MKSRHQMNDLDIDKVARAIEADAGESLTGLREALAQAKAGTFAAVHTPTETAARKRGRPSGSIKTDAKISTTIRFDPDVLVALKATGAGWQTRVNDLLRADIQEGRLKRAN